MPVLCSLRRLRSSASSASSAAVSSGAASQEAASAASSEAESDLAYVQDKGTLVVGMTDFAPMDYRTRTASGSALTPTWPRRLPSTWAWTWKFLEINWDNKLMELDTKGVDAIWNGMTITDEVTNGASVSQPYCNNGQVVVVPAEKAADYQTPTVCPTSPLRWRTARRAPSSWTPWVSPMWPRPPRPTP